MMGYLKWRKGDEAKKTFMQYKYSANQDWSSNLYTQRNGIAGGLEGWHAQGLDSPKSKKGDFEETFF